MFPFPSAPTMPVKANNRPRGVLDAGRNPAYSTNMPQLNKNTPKLVENGQRYGSSCQNSHLDGKRLIRGGDASGDGFDLAEVIDVVAGHCFDQLFVWHFAAFGMREPFGERFRFQAANQRDIPAA